MYLSEMGHSTCRTCKSGTYTDSARSKECSECPQSYVPSEAADSCVPAPTPSPTPAACVGDPDTFDAGWGPCKTYRHGKNNHRYCCSDRAKGTTAAEVCYECGVCR